MFRGSVSHTSGNQLIPPLSSGLVLSTPYKTWGLGVGLGDYFRFWGLGQGTCGLGVGLGDYPVRFWGLRQEEDLGTFRDYEK